MPDPISSLEGTWQMVRAELDGEKAPDLVAQKTELRLGDRTYEVIFGGLVADQGTYAIDHTTQDMIMVLTSAAGTNAGRRIPSLYQLAGNRLRVCYGLDNRTPDSFKTAAGLRRYLAFYRKRPAVDPL